MNTSLISPNVELLVKPEQNKDIKFVFDEFEAFVDAYFDEQDGKGNAVLNYDKGVTTLVVVTFKTCEVVVYRIDETTENDEILNVVIHELLKEYAVGDAEYQTTWNSLLDALEDYKIVDETMNP